MKVQYVHNLLGLELNKINSNLYSDILPEELDNMFNQAMNRYIVTKYDPKGNKKNEGFEMSNKRLEDLAPLVVEDYIDKLYTTSKANQYKFAIPNDFMFYVNSTSRNYGNVCNTPTSTTNVDSGIITLIPFSTNSSPLYSFSTFSIKGNITNTSIVDTSTIKSLSLYLYPENDLNFISDYLSCTITSGYSLYWENFKGVYYPNTLIVVKSASNVDDIKYTWNGSAYTVPTFRTVTNSYLTGLENGTYKNTPNIETQQDDIRERVNSYLFSPTIDEILLTRSGKYLSVYCSSDSVLETLTLTYIRKPKNISLGLQQDCELDDYVVYEIIASLVAHIKGINEDPNYQIAINEENKSE